MRFLGGRRCNPTETCCQMKEMYGDLAFLGQVMTKWYELFENGRTNIEGDYRQGRASTSQRIKILNEFTDYCLQIGKSQWTELRLNWSMPYITCDRLRCWKNLCLMMPRLLTDEHASLILGEKWKYSPYSLDLAPHDFNVFGPVKEGLPKWWYGDEIQYALQE